MRTDWREHLEGFWFHGGGMCYNFETDTEGSVTCHAASEDTEWIKTFGEDTYLCRDCQYDLELADKAYTSGRWLYEFECPCCERPFYVHSVSESEMDENDRLETVKEVYAKSEIMSEDALEISIGAVIQ